MLCNLIFHSAKSHSAVLYSEKLHSTVLHSGRLHSTKPRSERYVIRPFSIGKYQIRLFRIRLNRIQHTLHLGNVSASQNMISSGTVFQPRATASLPGFLLAPFKNTRLKKTKWGNMEDFRTEVKNLVGFKTIVTGTSIQKYFISILTNVIDQVAQKCGRVKVWVGLVSRVMPRL